METLIRQLVWLDFRLAILFAAIAPLLLLAWALRAKAEPLKRSLFIYWRVASLFAIAIYLAIGAWPIGFIAGFVARLLIPLSVWYWQDINEDIAMSRGILKNYFNIWRWAVSAYFVVSAVFSAFYVHCAFSSLGQFSNTCKIWLEPPLAFRTVFHAGIPVENLGFIGIVGVIVYGLYLASFLVFSLPKQGRIAFRN
jgi:Protein of unknown function (DUF3177)